MPKIVDKEEKRNLIIEAAVRVIAKLGFANAKMLQIAEAAGIGKGTIYEYFKSKEELFHAIINANMKEMTSQISKRIRKYENPKDKLQAYFDEWAKIFDSPFMEFAEIMLDFWAEGLRSEHKDKGFDLNKMYADYRVQLQDILNEGIETGYFKPEINSLVLASIIFGALDGIMIQWILDKTIFDLSEAVDEFARVTIDGISITN